MKKKLFIILLITLLFIPSSFAADGRTPTVYNKTLTLANTEYSQALPRGIKKFSIQCRTSYDVRLAYVTGKVAASTNPFLTIKSGNSYWEDNLNESLGDVITLYLASSTAGVVVEIVIWE